MAGERDFLVLLISRMEARIARLQRMVYKLKLQLYRLDHGTRETE